jgi:hypothetical protein
MSCFLAGGSLAEQEKIVDAEASSNLRGVRHNEELAMLSDYLHQHLGEPGLSQGLEGFLWFFEPADGHQPRGSR